MRQEFNIHDDNQPKQGRVFHHLKTTDYFMIVGPMTVVVITLFIWTVTTPDDSMMLGPAVALASVILIFLFCFVYGGLALILSLLTRRNISFRVGLAIVLISIVGGVAMLFTMI
jgi:hypothetical protein